MTVTVLLSGNNRANDVVLGLQGLEELIQAQLLHHPEQGTPLNPRPAQSVPTTAKVKFPHNIGRVICWLHATVLICTTVM